MIDAINSLSFSMQSNPGVYALLLGSGISRAAKIPTGWDVTLDLIRKLAHTNGEECDSPEKWYLEKFSSEPDYSVVLGELGKTQAERQQILRSYWEPTPEEKEEGAKQPTKAHRAIASLVDRGFIKVIITTNFDRLMEMALAEVGVTPTVISTPDQAKGAAPLIHTQCCIFKVHGDYLDSRIKNTPEELNNYPEGFNLLLDRIFDEFGLVVCGWSGEWDEALRNALFRTTSRRYSTYWGVYGDPNQSASRLIEQRSAHSISISGADDFFQEISQKVLALEEFSRPHPLSKEAAIVSLKKYLSEPRYRIKLSDLVNNEVSRVLEQISSSKFAVTGVASPNTENTTSRVLSYEAACETLMEMALVAGAWTGRENSSIWCRAIETLTPTSLESGNVFLIELKKYPATLIFYALGLGAVSAENLFLLKQLFFTKTHNENNREKLLVQALPPSCIFSHGGKQAQILEGMENRHAPLNDWLFNKLREHSKSVIFNEKKFELTFDRLEVLISLCYLSAEGEEWAPPGAYGYRTGNASYILEEISSSLEKGKDSSVYVKSGLFGNSLKECLDNLEKFKVFTSKISRYWW